MRTRVKFCGFKHVDQALHACDLGVDALGFIFYPPSPRYVEVQKAREIVTKLPAFVMAVGVFVNAKPAEIDAVLQAVPLQLLQFHGNETAEECRLYGLPYIKAIRMQKGLDFIKINENYHDASALMVDGLPGSGHILDWSEIPISSIKLPLILAGGLTAANVKEAISTVHPYAVDVSTGIESDKGEKSLEKMQAFMQEVAHG